MSRYGPVFTALYDPLLAWGERAGMRELRSEVLADANGRTLEIGAGTGLNADAYPAGVGDLTLAEPEPSMVARLQRLERAGMVVASGAEKMPFGDDSFDTVLSTLVLCTVADVDQALGEIRCVLRPTGTLLLIEHVRSARPVLARLQDRLHRPWRAVGYGCNCNRDTVQALRRAGLDTSGIRAARWRRMPVIVAPLIAGAARPTHHR